MVDVDDDGPPDSENGELDYQEQYHDVITPANNTQDDFEISFLTSNATTTETQTAKKFDRVIDYLTNENLGTDRDGEGTDNTDVFPDTGLLPKRKLGPKSFPGSSKNKYKATKVVNGNWNWTKQKKGNPKEAIITPKNANTSQWGAEFSILSISRCCNILPIENISRDFVTVINFSNLIMFVNVLTFLQKCSNLKELSFINIRLDPKCRIGTYNIYCNTLTSLSFSTSQHPLSSHEYALMDFFHRSVNSPKLKSFAFSGVDILDSKLAPTADPASNALPRSLSAPSLETIEQKLDSKPTNVQAQKFDPSLIGLFLIKNHPSLKFISCGGAGCRIFDQGMDEDHSELIKTVQVDSIKFGVDTQGMEYVLQAQTSLKSLTCCGFTTEIKQRFNRVLCSCIERNYLTLNSVAIFPCIISSNLVNGVYEDIYALNCQVFDKCNGLQKLYISVNFAESEKVIQRPCGTILNLYLLPMNLVHLELYTSEFHQNELNLFAQNFPHFHKLKRLALSCSSPNFYMVEPCWIQVLLTLPKILTLDFLGGRVANAHWFDKYIRLHHEDIIFTHDETMVNFYKRSYVPD